MTLTEKVDNIKWKKQFFESLPNSNLKMTALDAIKVISKFAFENATYEWAVNSMDTLKTLCDSPVTIESLKMDLDEIKELIE